MINNTRVQARDGRYYNLFSENEEFIERYILKSGFNIEKIISKYIKKNTYNEPYFRSFWVNYYLTKDDKTLKEKEYGKAVFLTSNAYQYSVDQFIDSHDKENERLNYRYKIRDNFNKYLSKIESKSILDVGCGVGDFSCLFAKNGYDVNAIDISEKMIQTATNNAEKNDLSSKIAFNILDIKNLKSKWKEKFDGILCVTVLQHIPKEDIQDVFEQFYYILKTGGIVRVDFQLGRKRGYDPDLRFVEEYSNETDVKNVIQANKIGFNYLDDCNTFNLKKGKNTYKRQVELNFVELWLQKY